MASPLPPGELLALDALVTPTPQGIASRVLARTAAGNITLFAFDAGEELSEHTAPFDALVLTLAGALTLTIGGREVNTTSQTIVLMPANVPHAVRATEADAFAVVNLPADRVEKDPIAERLAQVGELDHERRTDVRDKRAILARARGP